jgi:dihydrofolate reductase
MQLPPFALNQTASARHERMSMRTLTAFENISLDGYFADSNNDMSWAHAGSDDPEFSTFVASNAKGGGMLVFGRVTYEIMESFWPSPIAMQSMPAVAERMNAMPKLVFSRTLTSVSWKNTTLASGGPSDEMARLKQTPGPDMTILGSGSIVAQLAQARLIDEYAVVVNPVILGAGRALFADVKDRLSLKLVRSRSFGNGKTLLAYAPA